MSTLTLGINDVTKDAQAIKDKIASKDAQISAHQTQLLKQAAKLEEIQELLNDTLHKLNTETQKALSLEKDLASRNEQLQNEKVFTQNAQITLNAAQESTREKELEIKELQSILDSFSHKSKGDVTKLQQEKLAAEKKARTLEATIQEMKTSQSTAPPSRLPTRSRSSSLSNSKISILETDVADLRGQLTKTQQELSKAKDKIAQTNAEAIRVSNEKTALERKFASEVSELKSQLEDRDDELEAIRGNQGGLDREQELMQRIDEDEAKIEALEKRLRSSQDSKPLQQKLKAAEAQCKQQQDRLTKLESDNIDLVAEKEGALDELDAAHAEISKLKTQLSSAGPVDNTVANQAINELERIMPMINRLRSERDEAQRLLEFSETEQRFTRQALDGARAKLAALPQQTIAESDELDQKRVDLVLSALAIVVRHTTSESDLAAYAAEQAATSQRAEYEQAMQSSNAEIASLQQKLEESSGSLARSTGEYDELLRRLAAEEASSSSLRSDLRDKAADVEHLNVLLSQNSTTLSNLEGERDSLNLQITNLNKDLERVQHELTDAEARYSNLQSQQLNSMSSNQAVRSLKEHIHELEMRVMRRTEQIGILQHDVKRLETNLKLQEERITEFTSELEVAEAEKLAMVEDCADARERRDEEHARAEHLEEQVEALETSLASRQVELEASIASHMLLASKTRILRASTHHQKEQLVERIQFLEAAHLETPSQHESSTSQVEILLQREVSTQPSSPHPFGIQSAESTQALEDPKEHLEAQITSLRADLETKSQEYDILQDQFDQLEDEYADSRQQTSDLSQTIDQLLKSVEDKKQEVQKAREEVDLLSAKLKAATDERDSIVSRHTAEVSQLEETHRESLERVQLELDGAQTRAKVLLGEKATLEDRVHEIEEKLNATQSSREEEDTLVSGIQQRLDETTNKLKDTQQAHDELESLLEETRAELATVIEAQDKSVEDLQVAESSQNELQEEIANLSAQLSEKSTELESKDRAVQDLRDSLEALKVQHAEEKAALEQTIQEHEGGSEDLTHATKRADELNAELEAARASIEDAEEEKGLLQMEVTTLSAEVQKYLALKRHNEAQIHESEQKIAKISETLRETTEKLEASEGKAQASSANLTMQVIRHQQEIAALKKDLEVWENKPKLDVVVSELEDKNVELEELLRAKCQEIDENDEKLLEILQEKKKAVAKVDSLTRKVQLLQTKLAAVKAPESESAATVPAKASTPAPAVEVPAPAPSSSSRPSSAIGETEPLRLTQKSTPSSSTNRQPSLGSSSSSRPTISRSESGELARRPRSSSRAGTPQESAPVPELVPTRPSARSSTSTSRTASASSAAPRSKTPERKSVPAVFSRAKSPDAPMILATPGNQMETTSLAGQKRRSPDDHEPRERLHAQAFTIESTPVGALDYSAGITPRTRTLSNTPHSGFTPARRRPVAVVNDRPTIPMPSTSPKAPRTQAAPPKAPEVENIPLAASQQARPTRKTWLGKIRSGTSASGSSRP